MFAGQYLMERQGEQISWNVPTPAELNGDFSYGGRAGVNAIYDPRTTAVNNGVWSRSPFPGNIIPEVAMGPGSHQIPEQEGLGSFRISTELRPPPAPPATSSSPGRRSTDWANYSLRADQQFASRFKMFYNWSFNTRTAFTPNLDVVDLLYNSSQRISTDAQTTTGHRRDLHHQPDDDQRDAHQLLPLPQRHHLARLRHRFGALLGIPNIGKGSMPVIINGADEHRQTFRTSTNPSLNVEETFNFKEDISKLVGQARLQVRL